MGERTKKPTVLVFVGYYLPGYRGGGPTRTIANLVERLGHEFDFRIVTSDRDLGDLQPYPSIRVDAWNQVGSAQVFYASPSFMSLWKITRLLRNISYDVMYLNSFFSTKFTLIPLLAQQLGLLRKVPIVVAPRGEFSEGAFKLKRWKKFPFTRLVRLLGLFRAVVWHVSTKYEADDVAREMQVKSSSISIAQNIAVAPDLLSVPNSAKATEKIFTSENDDGLKICFLSRIVPMKNLAYALKVLALVQAPIQFHIYGPKELDAYWKECEALIEKLPSNVRVIYGGSVESSIVCATVAAYDLFFVPSCGENFGHVFMEALSAGVPILVSDRTPWRDLEKQNLGWDISLDRPQDFARAIEEAAAFTVVERAEMHERCIKYARMKAEDGEALELNRRLFLDAIKISLTTETAP